MRLHNFRWCLGASFGLVGILAPILVIASALALVLVLASTSFGFIWRLGASFSFIWLLGLEDLFKLLQLVFCISSALLYSSSLN